MRQDGTYTIYVIETMVPNYRDGEWFRASLDHFGYPPGFTASGQCWQETGEHGTYSLDEAIEGLTWIANRHPGDYFRVVQEVISKKTTEISTLTIPKS